MTRHDLIVRGARLAWLPGAPIGDVAVSDGVIEEAGEEVSGDAPDVVDGAGLHLLPGGIDPHVHLNEPGRTEWEGVATGTAALAVGGVTSAIDMPLNSSPPVLDGATFDLKAAAVERFARMDLALWGGLVPGDVDRLDELASRGVVGFKAFMSHGGLDDFPPADDLTLYEGMTRAAALGLPVAVHAESDAITAGLAARARAAGRTGVRDYLASRPIVAETEAIARAVHLAAETGCALHVVHVSTGAGVALVADGRARGVDVTCEVCLHHLVLDEEDMVRLGAVAKCAPPLRPRAECEALWTAVAGGDVAMLSSDHSPSPPELKEGDDMFAAWGGIAGAQSSLELLLSEGVRAGRLELRAAAELFAGAAGRRFGLRGKGVPEPGADADLVLVDLESTRVLAATELRQRHPVSPFVGRELRARVVRTIVRGATVARDGEVVGEPRGRLLRP
jgi:allantoinase